MSPPRKPARAPAPQSLKIQIDGAARGNPGPAGAGIALTDPKGRLVKELSVYLGETTNNVAETCALILALQEALKLRCGEVSVSTDSELLARQVNGIYKVRDARLQWLHALIRNLVESFEKFEIQHVPREENRVADKLANQAVDQAAPRPPSLFPD